MSDVLGGIKMKGQGKIPCKVLVSMFSILTQTSTYAYCYENGIM